MTSQVLNFMWLNLEIPPPPDPEDGSIRQPLPEKYIENVRKAGARHPAAQVVLWVDSKRLTERQLAYLKLSIEHERTNVQLQDLRSISFYNQEPLNNDAETNPNWRVADGMTALIWRQVDAAKVLVSLQGDFDQAFFADLDHAHLDIESPQVQGILEKHGLLIGSATMHGESIENQLWGFNRSRRHFFEQYYSMALDSAYDGSNAFQDLVNIIEDELKQAEKISPKEIILPIDDDGSEAEQPGSELREGYGWKSTPAFVSKSQLAKIFDRINTKSEEAVLTAQPGSTAQRISIPKTAVF